MAIYVLFYHCIKEKILLRKSTLFRSFCRAIERRFCQIMSGGHSRQKLDLTGQRYGHLTVLDSAANVGGRTAWRCLCDCGQEAVVKTHHLRCGHTKTCGCQNGAGGSRSALGLTYVDGTCVEILRAGTVRRNNTSGVPGVDWVSYV